MTEKTIIAYDWWLDAANTEIWAYTDDALSDNEIDYLLKYSDKTESYLGQMGDSKDRHENTEYRNSTISNLISTSEKNKWLFQRMTASIVNINKQFWNFDLHRIETLQYSEYVKGQFYKPHIDTTYYSATNAVRKLSFSVQLSDSNEYEGGDLVIHAGAEPIKTRRKKGTIVFFPSYAYHEVTEVTKGTRRALVGWVTGPGFK